METDPRNAWFEAPQGRHVLAAEQALMERALAEVFGFVLVQVGDWGTPGALLGTRRVATVVYAGGVPEPGAKAIECDGDALPFAAESIDAVVLPHALECAASPHDLVREVERVLVADGHLIVLGFDPWSLWGMRRRVGPQRFPFDQLHCIGETRLRDWLALLGLETIASYRHLHGLPLESEGGLRRAAFLERWGARSWPMFAGAYVLVARKRRMSVTPLRVNRERAAPAFGGAVTAQRDAA
jgi:SAM-dependent methyltransferase